MEVQNVLIRDALSEAIDEIDRYLREYPRAYTGDMREKILKVRNAMDELRIELETPSAL